VRPPGKAVKPGGEAAGARGKPGGGGVAGVRGRRAATLLAFAGVAACALAVAGRHLDVPGPYYDEVIQAVPAAQMLSREGQPPRVPGMESVRLLGRWVPVWTQSYMGALKSQVLAPVFALFGATPRTLRCTTLALGLVGVLLCMLFAARLLGPGGAAVLGALLALDPSFLFVSRHDWGSFALSLVARGGALLALSTALPEGRRGLAFAGGLCVGLGVYNKIDFAVFAAATALAAAAVAPGAVRALAGPRRPAALAAAAGALAGAAPLLVKLPELVLTTRAAFARAGPAADGAWSEKLTTLRTLLDGSHFERLILAGGRFDQLAEVEGAAAGVFPAVLAAAALFLAVRAVLLARRGRAEPVELFALLAPALVATGLLLTPRAVRIHHWLNLYPLPQLLVATAAVAAWRARPGALRAAARGAVVLGLGAALAGHLRADLHTLDTLRATGGKGRWSDALGELARELPPDTTVVSLDWGFHAPLRFLRPEASLVEPVWRLRGPRAAWAFAGDDRTLYLLHPEALAVFDYGSSFRAALGTLPPDAARVHRHLDREGDIAFLSIRLSSPHRLVYRGTFAISLAATPEEPPR